MSEPLKFAWEYEQKIEQLTKERDEARRERDCYDTQINAWYETFGTAQLTHAKARLDSSEKKRQMLEDEVQTWTDSAHSILKRAELAEKERDQLAAKVAEMRRILCRWDDYTPPQGQTTWSETFSIVFLERVHHALSDQCGTGWTSPEKTKALVEALIDCICTLGFANPETVDGKTFWACRERAKQVLEACK